MRGHRGFPMGTSAHSGNLGKEMLVLGRLLHAEMRADPNSCDWGQHIFSKKRFGTRQAFLVPSLKCTR